MQRVTEKQLQSIVDRINRITGSPIEPWTNSKANVGNYHLSHAYGGVCLHRMVTDGGGVSSPLSVGHVSKRELAGLLYAYVAGVNDGRGD